MSTLRDYQLKLKHDINGRWSAGDRNVLAVLPTGGGKTVVMGRIFAEFNGRSAAIAHRQELVGQISLALARERVHHRIIAPNPVIKFIVGVHVEELGASYHHDAAPTLCAGVDTLLKRDLEGLDSVRLWQTDEAHHLLVKNKWGRGVAFFPHARGLGWTATPHRADGRKLSRTSGDGVFDVMVCGPTMRELIRRGYLVDYVVFGPPASIDRAALPVSQETKDFTQPGMSAAARGSTIVGDVVASYLRLIPGKRALLFAVDVGMSEQHAEAFRQSGIPAVSINQHTKDRHKLFAALARGEIRVVCNCEVATEGTDVPAVDAVIGGRPTESLPLFIQMWGRMQRTHQGKEIGYYLDHVDNVRRHGLPDGIVSWTLCGEVRRSNGPRTIPTRACSHCFRVYEGYSLTCPYCGGRPARAEAAAPEIVEGDLTEYGPDLMAQLRQAAQAAVRTVNARPKTAREDVIYSNMFERAGAQGELREALAWWAGVRGQVHGEDDSTMYRRFYHTFGIDVLSAQALSASKARELAQLVKEDTWK